MMKSKKPINRPAVVFDNIDVIDLRFKKINNVWACTVKYDLISDDGQRSPKSFQNKIEVTDAEIKKMDKLIATLTDGKLGD